MSNQITDLAAVFNLILLSKEDFPIDFDDAWLWIGYSSKQKALDMLEKNFVEGDEYSTVGLKTSGQKGGKPATHIMLTVDCFKSFCMLAQTERGKQVRLYFIQCEKRLHEIQRERLEQNNRTPDDKMDLYRRHADLRKFISDAKAEMQEVERKLGMPIALEADHVMVWANGFFSETRLNTKLQRGYIHAQCLSAIPIAINPNRFKKLLKQWCWLRNYTLNPSALLTTADGRIMGKAAKQVQLMNGEWHSLKKPETVEFFYVQTRPLVPGLIVSNN